MGREGGKCGSPEKKRNGGVVHREEKTTQTLGGKKGKRKVSKARNSYACPSKGKRDSKREGKQSNVSSHAREEKRKETLRQTAGIRK